MSSDFSCQNNSDLGTISTSDNLFKGIQKILNNSVIETKGAKKLQDKTLPSALSVLISTYSKVQK